VTKGAVAEQQNSNLILEKQIWVVPKKKTENGLIAETISFRT
jgi:hypothetical protein